MSLVNLDWNQDSVTPYVVVVVIGTELELALTDDRKRIPPNITEE